MTVKEVEGMRLSRNNIVNRVHYLEKLIADRTKNLENAPDGKLRVSSGNDYPQYFCKLGGEKEKYAGKSQRELVKRLAQKEYDVRIIEAARSEITSLKILLKKYDRGTVEDIYDSLAPARRSIVEPFVLSDDEFIKSWLEESYEKASFEEGDAEFLTSKGLRVRSKSEIIIAEKYDEYNIPYKYECPLYLEGYGRVRPDFTILKIKYRQVKYHEHLGIMDDPEYAERNIKKIRAYEENGFILGRDLIITFETKKNPIGPMDIKRVIDNYLT